MSKKENLSPMHNNLYASRVFHDWPGRINSIYQWKDRWHHSQKKRKLANKKLQIFCNRIKDFLPKILECALIYILNEETSFINCFCFLPLIVFQLILQYAMLVFCSVNFKFYNILQIWQVGKKIFLVLLLNQFSFQFRNV